MSAMSACECRKCRLSVGGPVQQGLSFAKTCAALSRITIAIVLRSGLLTIVMARGPVGLMCALARRARQLCLACIA
jgi:hypothetical protein